MLFAGPGLALYPDARHGGAEERLFAIGRTPSGRWLFVVFTIREAVGKKLIRPLSARYMHRKEVAHYAKEQDT